MENEIKKLEGEKKMENEITQDFTVIKWSKTETNLRLAIVELCCWTIKSGKVSRLGKKIANTEWDDLSLAARNVLINHGVIKS